MGLLIIFEFILAFGKPIGNALRETKKRREKERDMLSSLKEEHEREMEKHKSLRKVTHDRKILALERNLNFYVIR